MKECKNIPEIRFKGFEGEWEVLRLNDISDIVGGGTPSTMVSEFWNGDIDWYSPTEIGENVYVDGSVKKITQLGLANSSAKILPKNKTILFTSRAGIGDMAILNKDGATNQGFQSFVLKNGIEPYFIYSAGHLIKKFALKHASGSTFLEVSGKILGEMKLLIPSEPEQSQIGTFFQNLDKQITLEQQKHDKLVTLKKAMLEKMFPKEGASVPEIRFEGFEGVWPKVILDEIVDLFKGKTLGWKDISDNGIYECILYGNLYTEYGMVINKVYYKTNNYSNELVLSKSGDVLIPSSDTTPTGLARASSIEKDGVILGGDINVLRPSKEINGSFISYNINANRDKLIKYIKGSTVRHLDNSDLKNVELYISKNPKEQSSIVNFFKKTDTLISLQQQKIDKLKNIKKACLDKMFV